MAQRRKPVRSALKAAVLPVLGSFCSSMLFIVGMTWRASKYESQLATVTYVDRNVEETRKLILLSNEESRKFAVEHDKAVSDEAHSFSNHNHDDMMMKFVEEKARGEITLEIVRRIDDRIGSNRRNVNH